MTRTDTLVPYTTLFRSGRGFINDRDRAVQHLGSIYERLLEQKLVEVDDGELLVRPSTFARKNSGSYYTHDDLVKLILRETLDPLQGERLAAFDARLGELRKRRSQIPGEQLPRAWPKPILRKPCWHCASATRRWAAATSWSAWSTSWPIACWNNSPTPKPKPLPPASPTTARRSRARSSTCANASSPAPRTRAGASTRPCSTTATWSGA